MLHLAFEPAEFLDGGGLAIAHYDIGFMSNDRLNKFSDGFARILVIAIGVDHDIGTMLERIVKRRHGTREPDPLAWHDAQNA